MLRVLCATVGVALVLSSTSRHALAHQETTAANALEQLLQVAFSEKNPKVTRAKVLELRSIGMGAGPYVLLGWGIRPDFKFEGSFEDELFGVFILDNNLRRIDRVVDIFPTCRWADCLVSIEKVSWPGTEITVVGSGSYGDGPFRKTYTIDGVLPEPESDAMCICLQPSACSSKARSMTPSMSASRPHPSSD